MIMSKLDNTKQRKPDPSHPWRTHYSASLSKIHKWAREKSTDANVNTNTTNGYSWNRRE